MHLTLLVPGLLLPVEILETTTYDLCAPMLSKIMGSGARQELPADWLPGAFGLDRLPAAALRKVSTGETAPGEWMCLDPVRWRVSPEGVTLDDPARLELDAAESDQLLAAVQPLFADWGTFSSSAPGRWELCLNRSPQLELHDLPAAIQQPIDPRLPGGADGAAWRLLLAEAQTLLHAHPVSRRRDEAGRPTANSLWPWGQGRLPAQTRTDFATVWSSDPVVIGLGKHAGISCLPTPAMFQPTQGNVLAIVEMLAGPARNLDALAWREAMLAVERDWLTPALAALKHGECTVLRLIGNRLGRQPETIGWELKRSDLLRFWRKPLPLTALQ